MCFCPFGNRIRFISRPSNVTLTSRLRFKRAAVSILALVSHFSDFRSHWFLANHSLNERRIDVSRGGHLPLALEGESRWGCEGLDRSTIVVCTDINNRDASPRVADIQNGRNAGPAVCLERCQSQYEHPSERLFQRKTIRYLLKYKILLKTC